MGNKRNGRKIREFEETALVHLDILYNTALKMTRSPEDAEDLVQETFIRAYRFFDKFEKGTNCKAWLFKIMRNNFINRYRKKAREPASVDFEEIANTYSTELKSDVLSSEGGLKPDRIFETMVEDDVKNAMDFLPEEFRTAIILSDIEGLSYQEIADTLDCPIGTVRSRISRGRKFLQKKLYDFARKKGITKEEI
jgi:RNA polymerase sigma-70 factor (ECF subfamily)